MIKIEINTKQRFEDDFVVDGEYKHKIYLFGVKLWERESYAKNTKGPESKKVGFGKG